MVDQKPEMEYSRIFQSTGYRQHETGFPSVNIIVPHYSGSVESQTEKLNTRECIEAISKLRYPNFSLTIIDSGSKDNFETEFCSEVTRDQPGYPLAYIRIDKNIGYAGSINVAAYHALQIGTSYLFLINNDTILEENCLDKLVTFADNHPEAAVVGPKIYMYQDGIKTRRIQTLGGRFIGGNFGSGKIDTGQYDKPRKVDFVTGAACLIRSGVVEHLGLFDSAFSIWFEDLDLGIRLRQANYKAYYYPAQVWHKRARSVVGRYAPEYAYYSGRNLLYTIRKHPDKIGMQVSIRFMMNEVKTLFGAIFIARNSNSILNVMRGIRDGFTNRLIQ